MRTFIHHRLVLPPVPGVVPANDDAVNVTHSLHGRVSLANTQAERRECCRSGHSVPKQFQEQAPGQPGGSWWAKTFKGDGTTCRKARNGQACNRNDDISGGLSFGDICWEKAKECYTRIVLDGDNRFSIMFWFSVPYFVVLVWVVGFLIRMRGTLS